MLETIHKLLLFKLFSVNGLQYKKAAQLKNKLAQYYRFLSFISITVKTLNM